MQNCMAYSAGMTPLRVHRKEAGLTLGQLAELVSKSGHEISDSQLSRIERQGAKRMETAMAIANVTGLPVEALAQGEAA